MLNIHRLSLRRSELNGNIIMKENAPQKQNELHTMQRLMRYLSPQIAEIVLKCPTKASLWESHRQEVTIVVLDLCGFTRFQIMWSLKKSWRC